jgi:hypothetical protein
MAFARSRPCSLLAVALLIACSDSAAPRFVDGDASSTPDATAMSCTSNAQCDDRVACTRDICVVGGMCEHVPDSPSCVVTPRCARVADCNDNVPCTRDSCLVDGTCSHTAQNDMCPAGQTCDTTRGCSTGMMTGTCRTEADCRDTFDCTIDSCGADGRCSYTAQNARCTTGQVCRIGMGCITERTCSSDADCNDMRRCNGVERCVEFGCVAGMAANCDDSDACTVDTCSETGTMCAHMRNPSCMGSGSPRSGQYTLSPGLAYHCEALPPLRKEVVRFDLSFVQITVTPSGITVLGGPAMMTGGPVSGGMFSASGSVAGDCVETYTLAGRFTDATHFTGTFSMMFAGFSCGITNCMNGSFPVSGTLAM